MYVDVCVYMCIRVWVYVSVYVLCVYVCVYVYVCVHMCTCVCVGVCVLCVTAINSICVGSMESPGRSRGNPKGNRRPQKKKNDGDSHVQGGRATAGSNAKGGGATAGSHTHRGGAKTKPRTHTKRGGATAGPTTGPTMGPHGATTTGRHAQGGGATAGSTTGRHARGGGATAGSTTGRHARGGGATTGSTTGRHARGGGSTAGRGRGRGRGGASGSRNGEKPSILTFHETDILYPEIYTESDNQFHTADQHKRGSHLRERDHQRSGKSHKRKELTGVVPFKQDKLKEMTMADDQTATMRILQNEGGFLLTFNQQDLISKPRVLKQLVMILYKLTMQAKVDNDSTALRVLAELFGSGGEYGNFVFQLNCFVNKIPTDTNRSYKDENLQALNYLAEISEFCVAAIPKTVQHSIQLLIIPIKVTVEALLKTLTFTERERITLMRIQNKIADIEVQLQSLEEEPQVKPKHSRIKMVGTKFEETKQEPPEPFTTLPILPLPSEINDYSCQPYLRANIIKGGYQDWDHYLDVQFRLLREDFIGPFREGITNYLTKSRRKGGEVRVYYNVRIGQPVCLLMGIGFEISFDMSMLRQINWEYTKRLITGSLLCLSTDNFNTIVFASVAQRDLTNLKHGKVIVQFESFNGFELDPTAQYTMVESVAYFEAYRHVLEKLIATRKTNEFETMPFQNYIVKCSFDKIHLPDYLRLKETIFDLRGVIKIKSRFFSTKVDLANLAKWPDSKITDLDPSQMKALQAALTQEISVIQGPPGTGKTYVGLKIVKAFLANKKVWDPNKTTPILVVCYTNHALDQFLEGICSDTIEGKPPIVTRIGGRCKKEILQDCVLREKVSKARKDRVLPKGVFIPYVRARETKDEIKEEVADRLNSLFISEKKILRLYRIKDLIPPNLLTQLLGIATDDNDINPIEVWLGLQYLEKPDDPANESGELSEPADNDHRTFEANADVQSKTELQQLQEEFELEVGDDDTEVQLISDDRNVEDNIIVHKATENEVKTKHKKKNKDGWQTIQMDESKKQKIIYKHLSQGIKPMSEAEASKVTNIWILNNHQKWKLYLNWRKKYIASLRRTLSKNSDSYRSACEDFNNCRHAIDLSVIQGSDVVGMTTTGAAKHNYIIKEIRPKIVVVEEAAEIFEPHIFTSLSPSVQQLVLIGDHQQLRPKPTYYHLEAKYDFNISLFERLAINSCPVQTLNLQHRMRPEIASLITPSIYKELYNHESVTTYPHVQGVGKNIYFVSHTQPEQGGEDDMKSRSNLHEAEYIGALCDYMRKQGYKSDEITILTLYRGQHLQIKNVLKRRNICGVRTAVVDDFQGEESTIILLSLVRSNPDQKIGFVGIDNRICVSLSRAKVGMFIIGNELMLRDNHKTVWPEIIQQLKSMECIGEALPLFCQIHQDYKVEAKTAKDFIDKCPEGGCKKKCNSRLPCGHTCPRLCHPYDQEHVEYKCVLICEKQLDCGHKCKQKCHKCSDGCFPCKVKVPKTLPCGHSQQCYCSDDPEEVKCKKLCDKELNCGHFCQEKCSEPCTVECPAQVDKNLSCGHTVPGPCYLREDLIECPIPCNTLLDCEHKCPGTCFLCKMGRLHIGCTSKCDRILTCGHACEFPCTPSCPPCIKPCANFCKHNRCPKKCFEPCAPCMEPCDWSCLHFKCTQPCGMPCNRLPCNQPCNKYLDCGHKCIGLCGELCPELCRKCNEKEVTDLFFGNEDEEDARFILLPDCNHIFEVNGLDEWMSQESEDGAVTLKVCPRCKTCVRKCLRYNKSINYCLSDLEEIKKKQISKIQSIDLHSELSKLKDALGATFAYKAYMISQDVDLLEGKIQNSTIIFPHIVKSKLNFLLQIVRTNEILEEVNQLTYKVQIQVEQIKNDLVVLKEFLAQEFLSQQQLSDAESEMSRLSFLARLLELQSKLIPMRHQVSDEDKTLLEQSISEFEEIGWKQKKMSVQKETQAQEMLEDYQEKYSIGKLSETKKLEIVKAIGLPKGHWYKCPNGHFYTIGECGGAMQRGRCPECKAEIGGMSHTLAAGNLHAPEMDGSRHTAWSEAANMENFDPLEFV